MRLKAEKRKGKGKTKEKIKGSAPSPCENSSETVVDEVGEAVATGVGSGFQGNIEIVATDPKKSRNKRSKKSTVSPTSSKKRGKTSDGVVPLAEGVVDGNMPPPGDGSSQQSQPNRMIIKRRATSVSSKKTGGEEAKPRLRRPRMKRPRSTESGRRSATEGSDADDSWGEESMEEDRREEKGLRSSAYGTRDRSGRVKYVEEASENEGQWESTWVSMVWEAVWFCCGLSRC